MKRKALAVLFWLSPIAAILIIAIAFFTKREMLGGATGLNFVFIYFLYYPIVASLVLNRKRFFLQILYVITTTFIVLSSPGFLYMLSVSDDWKTKYIVEGWAVISGTILLVFALIHFIRLKLIPYYKEKHKLKES